MKITKNISAVFWTTKDGKKINVDDMDINHLRNVLKAIIRNNPPKAKVVTCNITNKFIEEGIKERYNDECDASEIDIW